MILLWHRDQPIGICVFSAPAASLTARSHYFGLTRPRSRVALSALNEQLWLLQRVVLHPAYRGAGIAAEFIRRACELCPVDWIETLSVMGHANPVFERAGFVRAGIVTHAPGTANGAYGTRRDPSAISASPVYYVFDRRGHRPRTG